MKFSKELLELSSKAEERARPFFERADKVSEENTARLLDAFSNHRVSDSYFGGTTGYGYDDIGREKLDDIYAEIFGAEKALVRIGFVNGTHAITCALFGALRPGQTLVSLTGTPYDTLLGVIGSSNKGFGSLTDYGVKYREMHFGSEPDGEGDVFFLQRSRGYSTRPTLSVAEIGKLIAKLRKKNPQAVVVVDNCYGEFAEISEPTHVGADLVAGSLIKNPGGGLAPAGGYIAGRQDLVERAAARMTAPGIGGHCGPSLGQSRLLYQGLFMAPHTVAQAKKTAIFCASLFQLMGYECLPSFDEKRSDIIQAVKLGSADLVKKFCAGIQKGAPVDSFVTPEPWDMPGYDCQVIMAAGAFVQGASIELSADAPMREPYCAYLQGGLTYESGKLGIMRAAAEML
ncbi:MAG: aminotransferase class I/II-fold pyridoxal phosphate-dependent enzyme [Oscillospiraceae bacterium]|jgi:cystathionine beta-lyase family protein involved in aluminum resistance